MKKFLPIEEDLNILNSEIEAIKNETLQNIQKSPVYFAKRRIKNIFTKN